MIFIASAFKWLGLSIASLLILVILAGVTYRWLGPQAPGPEGELVDVGGFRLHIHATGTKNNRPTVVMENGGGLPTEFFHWLNEGLQDSLRVVRYDRAGLGNSDECITPRDPETIAHELHTLLEKAGEEPPYLLAGHSMGGPYIRVFAQLYPEEVAGLIFLDPTHHNHVELFHAPKETSFIYRTYVRALGAQAVAADLGILSLWDKTFGTPYSGEGLPDEINHRIKGVISDGKSFRAYQASTREYYATLARSGEANDFGDIPVRVYKAVGTEVQAYGIAPEQTYEGKPHPHQEFAELSTDGEIIFLYGNHVTIFTKKENADIICEGILEVARELAY
ncbi:MAG: alpha/beta hydrolase [Bacteroidota bacterium]